MSRGPESRVDGNFPPPLTAPLNWANKSLGVENFPVTRPVGLPCLTGRELPCGGFGTAREFWGWAMPRRAGASAKAERDQLRDRMRALGCSIPQIAAEMGRRFNLRPRLAWRHALDWPQWKLAQRYNTLHPGARLSDHRVSEYETWPHGGALPSLRYLARLAITYGHGCTPS
jgi:hypothetical protein